MPNNSLNPKKNHKCPLIMGGLIILIILIPMVMLGADYMALNADNEPPFSKIRFETCLNDRRDLCISRFMVSDYSLAQA